MSTARNGPVLVALVACAIVGLVGGVSCPAQIVPVLCIVGIGLGLVAVAMAVRHHLSQTCQGCDGEDAESHGGRRSLGTGQPNSLHEEKTHADNLDGKGDAGGG